MIEFGDVWKSYGNITAVRGLSLNVPRGSIYGFLGPNGAGKSTTIRMILGLQRPDRGTVHVFGKRLDAERAATLRRIGSLVESPSLYPHLTGRENLEVHRRLMNGSKAGIDDALHIVGLGGAANRIVRGYSSGMKQRLGIAQALLGNPELLVLDEPTNGLDPAGIHEIRTLIRKLAGGEGRTIFVSSHLLKEVEQVATHVGIVCEGQLRFEGTIESLRARTAPTVMLTVDDAGRACEILKRAGVEVSREAPGNLKISDSDYSAAEINSMLVYGGVAVSHLAIGYPTLEEAFMELTIGDRNVEVEHAV